MLRPHQIQIFKSNINSFKTELWAMLSTLSKLLLYVNSCLICVYFYSSWGVLAEHLRKLIRNQEVH